MLDEGQQALDYEFCTEPVTFTEFQLHCINYKSGVDSRNHSNQSYMYKTGNVLSTYTLIYNAPVICNHIPQGQGIAGLKYLDFTFEVSR